MIYIEAMACRSYSAAPLASPSLMSIEAFSREKSHKKAKWIHPLGSFKEFSAA
jgi:hypothetical protein